MPESNKIKDDDLLPKPAVEKRLLNPVDRISEVLFGLIMALTFTCTISVAEADRTEVRDMLIGAIGCNIAWGLVDAVMFILTMLAEKGHGRTILNFVRKTSKEEKAREFIADALPPIVTSVLQKEDLENMRKALLKIPESNLKIRITMKDIKIALGIFLLVFLSTFPVAIPFAFIHKVQLALRISNLIAIVFMFICGWLLARYGGYNKLLMGFIMTLLGVILVAITIALGG
jgi:VIT family